ncbi:protein kinase superfamily protein [Striga asiatica]|uniref:Protein kinase superfamily protein n=1 Tax=Striga asiatica TaxID=4170 RepID=A0A5A7Q2A0_STRAF|nr:protein kinase superfamily protein [Striga asiatica]
MVFEIKIMFMFRAINSYSHQEGKDPPKGRIFQLLTITRKLLTTKTCQNSLFWTGPTFFDPKSGLLHSASTDDTFEDFPACRPLAREMADQPFPRTYEVQD